MACWKGMMLKFCFLGAQAYVPYVCTCGTSGTLAIFGKIFKIFDFFLEFENFSKIFQKLFLSKIDGGSSHFDHVLVWAKSKKNNRFWAFWNFGFFNFLPKNFMFSKIGFFAEIAYVSDVPCIHIRHTCLSAPINKTSASDLSNEPFRTLRRHILTFLCLKHFVPQPRKKIDLMWPTHKDAL